MKKIKKNSISLFNVVMSIFLTSGVLVLLVYNIIHVNNLAANINNAKMDLTKQINLNNSLRSEIERLSTYDNIKPIVVEKLRLENVCKTPKWIIVNKSDFDYLK
jgi:hypothetical protein